MNIFSLGLNLVLLVFYPITDGYFLNKFISFDKFNNDEGSNTLLISIGWSSGLSIIKFFILSGGAADVMKRVSILYLEIKFKYCCNG